NRTGRSRRCRSCLRGVYLRQPGGSPAPAPPPLRAANGGVMAQQLAGPEQDAVRSLIPARLDRLRWSRFHTRLVVALGVAWVLDGLEVTIASNSEGLISQKQALGLSSAEVAFAVGTVYLLGEVFGALLFGRMSDKWGRRNLF